MGRPGVIWVRNIYVTKRVWIHVLGNFVYLLIWGFHNQNLLCWWLNKTFIFFPGRWVDSIYHWVTRNSQIIYPGWLWCQCGVHNRAPKLVLVHFISHLLACIDHKPFDGWLSIIFIRWLKLMVLYFNWCFQIMIA